MGPQVLPANLLRRGLLSPWVCRSCQEPAPAWSPHGVTASFRHPPAPVWGPFHRLQVEICPTVVCSMAAGEPLLRCLEHLLPSSCTDHGLCRVVPLTWSCSTPLTAVPQQVFLLLQYVIPEALPPSLVGSALASSGSFLELAATGSVRHRGSFWRLLTEATPVAHPPPCYQNIATQTHSSPPLTSVSRVFKNYH